MSFHVRGLPAEVHASIQEEAEQLDVSTNWLIKRMLTVYMELLNLEIENATVFPFDLVNIRTKQVIRTQNMTRREAYQNNLLMFCGDQLWICHCSPESRLTGG
jgi:hypothetical protein